MPGWPNVEPPITYHKTRQGEPVVMGPVDRIRAGMTVEVEKKDGTTTTERILTVGTPFRRGVTEMVYGYLAGRTIAETPVGEERCEHCGKGYARFQRTDLSGIEGLVCVRCNSISDDGFRFI